MVRVERTIVIQAPPAKVWELLALDRIEEWQVSPRFHLPVKGMAFTSDVRVPDDKYRVGTSAQPKRETEDVLWTVTESRTHEHLTYRCDEQREHGLAVTYTMALEPVAEGTQLTYAGELDMPWGLVGRVIQPFAKRLGEREIEMTLQKLKSLLET